MAEPARHFRFSDTEKPCVIFGAARAEPLQVAEGAAQIGLPTATPFDADHWFRSLKGSERPVTPIILLNAAEGVGEQDRFFARLVRFLDLADPVVLVANLDLVGYERDQFDLIQEEYRDVLANTNLSPLLFAPLPMGRPDLIPWWQNERGSDTPETSSAAIMSSPLRIKVVSSTTEDGAWVVTGDIISGTVTPGDEILSSPSNQQGVVRTKSQTEGGLLKLAFDSPFFAESGEVISHQEASPVETDVFRVKALWAGAPRTQGDPIFLETSYGSAHGAIQSVEQILSPSEFKPSSDTSIAPNTLVELIVRVDKVVAIDHIANLPKAAGISILDANDGTSLLATGHISMEGYADQRHLLTPKSKNTTPIEFEVGEAARATRNGHEGGVLWFTGLSGSGKSTLAVALEARLFEKGYQVFVLDGDNVRQGLTSNLGFSPDDRSENIRRVGEVAALFRQAGVVVISSFISPYRSDRDRARHAAYSSFHEVYIKADIETCIDRDPKGLYERAIKGDIPDFTGISAPYEAPTAPELVVDTGKSTIDACVEQLVNYVDSKFRV